MHTDESDAVLVRLARAGDKEAFTTLLGRHRPLLLALCRRMCSDPVLAEDAAQEAMLQALLGLDHLRHAEQFGPWLGGIGLNICRRWLRDRSYEAWSWEALYGGRRVQEPVDWSAGPEDVAEAADLVAHVRRAVADLPPRQRAAVMLFYLSGLTHAETAAVLGIDVGAVKTRLHNARTALRRQLWAVWNEQDMARDEASQLVAMRVVDVRRGPPVGDDPRLHMVVLEEVGGAGRMGLWIGPYEGQCLAMSLEQVTVPRPMTYALTAHLLDAVGARLHEVHINKLVENTFYAVVVVDGPRGRMRVDARPSDALNLALIQAVPIRVDPAVLEAEQVTMTQPDVQAIFYGEGSAGAAGIVAELGAGWPGPSQASDQAH
jgi:RNA polymerase sigma factor (sigma-70 family)